MSQIPDKEIESQSTQDAQDAESLYSTLENEIIPLYYRRDPKEISQEWIGRVKDSLKTNVPRFSTRRMVKEYVERLYVKALASPSPNPVERSDSGDEAENPTRVLRAGKG